MTPRRRRSSESASTWRRLRFLVTPRWIALEIAVVAFVLACYFLLAPWQFSRSAEHDAQVDAVAAAVAAPPRAIDELMSTDSEPASDLRWHRVRATGHFAPSGTAYIRLRQDNNGQPAYEVVVPFVTDGGARVLVDRGYVPFTTIQEGGSAPAPPTGTVTITGRIQPDQTDPRHRPPAHTPDGTTAYTAVNSDILRSDGGDSPVYRGFLQLVGSSPGVIDAIALPDSDGSRPFFSYAIQWLLFGAIAVLGLGYFIYREFTDPVDTQDIYLPDDEPDDPEVPDAGPPASADTAPPRGDAEADDAARPRKRRRFDKSQLYDAP